MPNPDFKKPQQFALNHVWDDALLERCTIDINGTGSSFIDWAPTSGTTPAQSLVLKDCTLDLAASGQGIGAGGHIRWYGGTLAGTAPAALIKHDSQRLPGHIEIVGVDLSNAGASSALASLTDNRYLGQFRNCKLGSSVAVTEGTHSGLAGPTVELVNCDSADTSYRYYRENYQAVETHETTVVRSGGATDGTTPVSRKIATTANVTAHAPYVSQPIEFWNETVGSSVSLSIPILTDNVTLTDAEAWVEVEYLGTSGFPLALFTSDRVSDPIFGTPANQATDGSSSWTTTGLGTPVKQTLSVSFTPQEKGIIRARVCVAKASTTVYYDPLILASSGRQYQGVAGYLNEGVSGGGGGGGTTMFVPVE